MTAEELKEELDEFELQYTECGTLKLVRTEKEKGERERRMNVGKAIEKITQTPTRKYTKEEAEQILRSCGILDSKNNIKSAYRKIISEKQSESKDV